MGTVYSIQYQCVVNDEPTNADEIPIVFVQMDEFRGQSCYTEIERVVPFSAISSHIKLNNRYTRWQLPLAVAHASTAHRYQGQTAKKALILYPPKIISGTMRGLAYVMMSRPTRIEDVILINPLKMQHFNDDKFGVYNNMIREEYLRLESQFPQNL